MKSKIRHSSIITSLLLFHTFILVTGGKWKPGDPCPTEIRSGIPNSWHEPYEDKFGYMEIIHAAMLICPNIKILELYSTGETPCFPPTKHVVWPFNESVPRTERWASAPEVLILDDFRSDTILGPDWIHRYGQQYHAAWYVDWYRDYMANLTSSHHDKSEGQQQGDEQKGLGDNQEIESAGIKGNNENFGSMPTTQGLMEVGSNSSATDHEKEDTPETPNGKKETNFDIWLQVMDFSRIHTLKLGKRAQWWGTYTLTHRLAKTLPPHLVSLKNLELKNTIGADFLLNLPKITSLTHLTWREPWTGEYDQGMRAKSLLVPILKHHGSTMETLYLHAYDTGTFYRPALSTHELRNLTRLAPNIKKLTIDLRRAREKDRQLVEEWPWEDLKILATGLQGLTDLMIYFELRYMPCQYWPPSLPTFLPTGSSTQPASIVNVSEEAGQSPPRPIKSPATVPGHTCETGIPQPQSALTRGPFPESSSDDRPKTSADKPPNPLLPELEPETTATPPKGTAMAPTMSMPFAYSPKPSPCSDDPCQGREKYAQPMVSRGEGEKIARFLAHERAAAGGKPFQRIRIRSGNGGWGTEGGYMSDPIAGKAAWDWIDGKSSWVSCFGKDWGGRLPDEERNKIVEEGEFACFAGENLEELKEWEERCRGVKRHATTEGAWQTAWERRWTS
ncbi:hypothetical protein V8F06_011618 [Rhypophila decipiens]